MIEAKRPTINWMDVLWLVLLALLAVLPPVQEIHKQFILLAFGVLQLSEGWLIARVPRRAPIYLVPVSYTHLTKVRIRTNPRIRPAA